MRRGDGHHTCLSRRAALQYGAGSAILTSLVGCDLLSTDPEGEQQSGGGRAAEKGAEAPMLTERVKAGDLPAVEKRLPDTAQEVEPAERIGTYGGTWNSAVQGSADTPWLGRTIGYESLTRWTPDGTDVLINIAESIEQSDDGREFTITLRAGMKWSDGQPYTADDVLFSYQDVSSNEELTPVFPSKLTSRGEPLTMEKIDDRAVRVIFPEPSGLFFERMAIGSTVPWMDHPKHYLEQFHIDYGANVEQLVEEEGYADWVELFDAKKDMWNNPELPTLRGWMVKTPLSDASRVVAERNPYYWKVDPEGSQLPYIDEVVYEVISDAEVILLNATNGEIDFHTRHINTLPNKPILARSREQGEYDFNDLKNTLHNEMVIALNLAHKNQVLREVFQNKDFRIGLSHAINREELIKTVFQRQGEPYQAAPIPDSEFFDEEFAKQYTEYDVDLANEHLDRAGYTERDGGGFRLGPDGNRISFNVEVAIPAFVPFWPDAMELVVGYWEAVGIRAHVKTEDRSLFYERKEANDHDANVWTGDGGYGDEMHEPRWYFPFSVESNYATPWAAWFNSFGDGGEEPVEPAKRQMELYYEVETTPDERARKELFRELLRIAKEEFWVIGTLRVPDYYGIKRNDFHNVPEIMPESARFGTPALSNPEQYYIDG